MKEKNKDVDIKNKKTAESDKVTEKTAEAVAEDTKEKTEAADEKVVLTKAEFDQVKEHIEKLQAEKDDTVALAQRLQADFDNFRRRNASIHVDSMEEGTRQVIKELLPVLDNFDRALESDQSGDAWRDGIKLVHKQLMDVLTKQGLDEIKAEGKFDPLHHDAVLQEERSDVEPETIIEVLQKGYKVKDRIIRHSMVKVSK